MNNRKLKICPYCGNALMFEEDKILDAIVNTKSVEHIIPQSLGNDDFILDKGIICDKCNNYFAINIEKPFMELSSISLIRAYHSVPNKKNKFPQFEVSFLGDKAAMRYDNNLNGFRLDIEPATALKLYQGQIPSHMNSYNVDIEELKNNYIVSRMLVKIFTEVDLFYELQGLNESYKSTDDFYFIYDAKMEELIRYVRYGNRKKIYSYDVYQDCEIKPLSNENDNISIEMNLDNLENVLIDMTLKLYELVFVLHI